MPQEKVSHRSAGSGYARPRGQINVLCVPLVEIEAAAGNNTTQLVVTDPAKFPAKFESVLPFGPGEIVQRLYGRIVVEEWSIAFLTEPFDASDTNVGNAPVKRVV